MGGSVTGGREPACQLGRVLVLVRPGSHYMRGFPASAEARSAPRNRELVRSAGARSRSPWPWPAVLASWVGPVGWSRLITAAGSSTPILLASSRRRQPDVRGYVLVADRRGIIWSCREWGVVDRLGCLLVCEAGFDAPGDLVDRLRVAADGVQLARLAPACDIRHA